jgi:Bacterial antitoxin of ParD toxin-antitoxin type II system and RHH
MSARRDARAGSRWPAEHETRIAALPAALIGGERNGRSEPIDVDRVLTGKRARAPAWRAMGRRTPLVLARTLP